MIAAPGNRFAGPAFCLRGADRPRSKQEIMAMNWDQIEGKWKEVTGQVQQQWGKLTDDDLTQIKGDRRELAGRIQQKYGVTKEAAEQQIDDWMRTR